MIEWVYYVPDLDALCIVRPEFIEVGGGTPVEWGWKDLIRVKKDMYLDSMKDSPDRNCEYVGDF